MRNNSRNNLRKILRKIQVKILFVCLLAVSLSLFLFSCAKADKSCTLTFASWYTEEDTLAYRDIAAKYQELYPNVTVEFITLEKPDTDFTVYTENAMKAIREGQADLVLLHPSAMTLIYENDWVGSHLADVSQSPLFQQYSNAMRQLVTGADGTAYGYPSFMSFAGLLVNTDLLASCGITELPSTYSSWVSSMETVKQAGYIPFASYDGSDSSSMFLISAMAQSRVLYGEIPRDAETCEIFTPAISGLYSLMDTGLLERPGSALTGGTERDVVTKAFPQGNVAFTICPSWYVPKLKEAAPDFNYSLIAIPASDRGPIVDIRAGWPVGISASSIQQDEILRFLSFALLPENMELLAGSKGNVSPLKNNTTSDEFYGTILGSIQEGCVYSDSSNLYGFDMVDTLNRTAQLLHGNTSLDQVLRDFKTTHEKVN